MFDLRFPKDFTYIVSGPSRSGKTIHVCNLIKNQDELFASGFIKNSHYFYREWQDSFDSMKKEGLIKHWHNKLPTEDFLREISLPFQGREGTLVIIDDFGSNLNSDISLLFTVLSHHCNISVVLILQTLFSKNPVYREIQLSAQYLAIFRNNRDKSQIINFAKQFSPKNINYVLGSFMEATKQPYTYVLFDLTQRIPDMLRMRSNMLIHEWPMKVWIEKSCI